VSIDVPEASNNPSFVVTKQGTFKKGNVVISKSGMGGSSHQKTAATEDIPQLPNVGEELSMSALEILNHNVGSGACSTVKIAKHIPTGRIMALKVVNVFDKERRYQLMNELSALTDNKSEHLVSFYGAFYSEGLINICLEYMDGGSLADLCEATNKQHQTIPEDVLGCICSQVLEDLEYLHNDCKRVHRDIKPANILLSMDGNVKVSDFGVSRLLDDNDQMCQTFVGTTNYMSPERLNGDKYTYSSDMWSFGLSALECRLGVYPYPMPKGFFELLNHIVNGPIPELNKDKFSAELADFITATLQKDPEKRKSATELRNHPFVLKYKGNKKVVAAYLAKFRPQQK